MMEDEVDMPKKKTEDLETPAEATSTPTETSTEETPVPTPDVSTAAPTSDPAPGDTGTQSDPEESTAPEPEPEPEMPKHVALMPPTLLFPPGRMALVENNAIVRRIGATLSNGAKFSQHPHINFNVHQGLMILMRNAFEARKQDISKAEENFFMHLKTYLEQAQGRIPGVIAPGEIEPAITQARALIGTINGQGRTDGFEQVARYLILLANAPLAHF